MAKIPSDIFTAEKTADAGAKSVLIVTGDKVEDLEFFYPYYRFVEAGHDVDVATPEGGAFKGKMGYKFQNALRVADVDPQGYDLLFLPGGKAPATLMKDQAVLDLVRTHVRSGKMVAAICHGPQILAAADVIRGHSIAGWPEIEEEIERADALYVSDKAVADGKFITARWPADLPHFMKRVEHALRENVAAARKNGAHAMQRAI